MQIQPPTSKKGFTLVELLVSIAIVAVLASLAVMGTRIALKAATAATTVNNMKSIGTIIQSIATEGLDTGGNNPPGTFPPYEGTLDDDLQTDFVWWELIAEQMGVAERKSSGFDWNTEPRDTQLQNPLSKKKLGGTGKFTSFDSAANTRGGFAYNAQLGGGFEGETGSLEGAVAVASLEDEANTIVFGESDDNNSDPGYYFTSTNDAPQGNYKDGAHCYFASGSVQLIKNVFLKDKNKFEFFTVTKDKDRSSQR